MSARRHGGRGRDNVTHESLFCFARCTCCVGTMRIRGLCFAPPWRLHAPAPYQRVPLLARSDASVPPMLVLRLALVLLVAVLEHSTGPLQYDWAGYSSLQLKAVNNFKWRTTSVSRINRPHHWGAHTPARNHHWAHNPLVLHPHRFLDHRRSRPNQSMVP